MQDEATYILFYLCVRTWADESHRDFPHYLNHTPYGTSNPPRHTHHRVYSPNPYRSQSQVGSMLVDQKSGGEDSSATTNHPGIHSTRTPEFAHESHYP